MGDNLSQPDGRMAPVDEQTIVLDLLRIASSFFPQAFSRESHLHVRKSSSTTASLAPNRDRPFDESDSRGTDAAD